MTFTEFKEAVIARADAMGLADYELYYQAAESTSVSAFQHQLNQFTSSIEGGVCFRCIVNGKMGYASTEELSEVQAKAIVEKAFFGPIDPQVPASILQLHPDVTVIFSEN